MKRGFKPSLREQMRQSLAAQKWLAAGAPDEKKAIAAAHLAGMEAGQLPPVRHRAAPKPSTEPTEKEIQSAILDYLRLHPKVAFVGRFNRGVMQSSYQGRESYVQFNTLRGFPDIHGCLKGGRALYIEVKRPGRKPTEDQAAFLAKAEAAGALAITATSAEQVAEALRDA